MPTVLQGRSLGCARDDNGAKRYQNSAALLIFMRRTIPVEPLEPIEPAEPLSHAIKGRYASWANPEPINLNPEPVIYLFKASIAAAASIVTPRGRMDSSMEKLAL